MGRETGWLIEHEDHNPRHRWLRAIKYSGDSTGTVEWTEDANLALRFGRRSDAIDFAWLFPEMCTLALITEHVFDDGAALEPPAALNERQQQAYPKLAEFFHKYALGSKLPPSCFVCGHVVVDVGVSHAELPGIVCCQRCKRASDAARNAQPPGAKPDIELIRDQCEQGLIAEHDCPAVYALACILAEVTPEPPASPSTKRSDAP